MSKEEHQHTEDCDPLMAFETKPNTNAEMMRQIKAQRDEIEGTEEYIQQLAQELTEAQLVTARLRRALRTIEDMAKMYRQNTRYNGECRQIMPS